MIPQRPSNTSEEAAKLLRDTQDQTKIHWRCQPGSAACMSVWTVLEDVKLLRAGVSR